MDWKIILDGTAQFTFLMGVLTSGLSLIVLTNRLFDRPEKTDDDRNVLRLLIWVLYIQYLIAVALVVRIVFDVFHKSSPYYDLLIVATFLADLLFWGYILWRSYSGFLRRKGTKAAAAQAAKAR